MSVLLPGQSPCYLRQDLQKGMIAREGPFLQVQDPLVIEDDLGITFDILLSGQVCFKGHITKLAPPLVFHQGILYQDSITGQLSHWVVQVPHGTFTATLQLGSEVQYLSGMAYQDHQWGSTLLQESVADWVWGHFSNYNMAVLFFQILTQYGQKVERVAMLTAEDRYTGTALGTNYLNALSTEDNPSVFSWPIATSFFRGSQQIDFSISPNKIMRSRLNEIHGQKAITYLRWAGEATYQGACGQSLLYGISEYIRVRPAGYEKLSQRKHCEHHLRHHDGDLLGDSHSL
jgi:hypothetical protein